MLKYSSRYFRQVVNRKSAKIVANCNPLKKNLIISFVSFTINNFNYKIINIVKWQVLLLKMPLLFTLLAITLYQLVYQVLLSLHYLQQLQVVFTCFSDFTLVNFKIGP
jgi:hypothetical protein